MNKRFTRRQSLKMIGAGLAATVLPSMLSFAASNELLQKRYSGDKKLPVIGMGTWRTFNVGTDPKLLDARTEVVRTFFELGGSLIDSSPMYGSAPDVMGYALQQLGIPDDLFSAEKSGALLGGSAREQVADLQARWNVEHFDLVQVHNLTDWREHLAALREMKAEGKIGHIGITTSHGRRHREFEQIMTSENIDFVQLTYNISHREVEKRLLPLAEEKGIAVIANRPFDGGSLIKGLKSRATALPEWAETECGCTTCAEFLLKFIVSHPAITCAIPATTKVEHLRENMRAGMNPMPSVSTRQKDGALYRVIMNMWSNFALQDFIPFTADIYIRLLERMNETFWPLHLLTLALGAAGIWLALKNRGQLACLLIATVWAFVGFAFFIQRYAELNWAGSYIGYFFFVQTSLLILIALMGIDNASCKKPSAVIGIAIAIIGLIGLPSIAPISGSSWYQSEVFGIHADPTAITTLGISLIMFRGWALWLVAIIPALWLLISGLTLWVLGSPAAILLFAILAMGVIALVWKSVEYRFV